MVVRVQPAPAVAVSADQSQKKKKKIKIFVFFFSFFFVLLAYSWRRRMREPKAMSRGMARLVEKALPSSVAWKAVDMNASPGPDRLSTCSGWRGRKKRKKGGKRKQGAGRQKELRSWST
jgi:hypothetical protein